MSVHTSKSGRPSGVLESVKKMKNTIENFVTSQQPDKAMARPDAYGFIHNLNECSFAHRYNGDTSMGELAIIAPEGCKLGLTMPEKIVKAVNEHAALEAVAEAAKVFEAYVPEYISEEQGRAARTLNEALANLAAIRSQKA